MDGVDFEFGGRLSLDLTWTLRFRAVHPTELLRAPTDLVRWLAIVDLPVPLKATARQLGDAVELREAIVRAANALIDGTAVDADDRALLNHRASKPPPAPLLRADGGVVHSAAKGGEFAAALSAIARDAIALLATADGRLRRCAGPNCSLLFYDNSRPGARRWCSTARCGNKVNTTAYRRRSGSRPSDSTAAG